MAQKLNDLQFIQGANGSGRIAAGTDYIAGLMVYNNTRPTAMGADNYSTGSVRQIFSPSDAVNLGVDNSFSDETQSTSTYQITAIGSNGDTLTAKVQEWTGGSGQGIVTLGVYTKVSGDTTVNAVATGLAAAINAGNTGPNAHGYSAVAATDTVTITARKGTGIYFNTGTPYTKVIVGGITATIVQNVIAGVYSKNAVLYYHIQRYFIKKSDGTLFIGIFNTAGASGGSAFNDLLNMENAAVGTMVQCGIWDDTQTYALASLTKVQTQIAAMKAAKTLLSSVVYAADIKALSTPLASLAGASYNLATLTASNVSDLIDNDGNGNGLDLFYATGKTISSLGACLGCISGVGVSDDIGQPIDALNCDDGTEFDTLMFGDGTLYSQVSSSQLDALNNNRHIFLSKVAYTPGSFYSDDHTAIALTSDYAYIHDNRIIDKVVKGLYVVLSPVLKSKLKLKTDGTMTAQTIAHLVQLCGTVISPMIASEDLAGDPDNFDASQWIIIDPRQTPNTTGKLIISVKLVENATAHSISVPIGFVKSL